MDVATVAFMLFIYAWQAGRLAGLAPEDEAGAQKALRNLLAIAFLHDADKYRDQDGPWNASRSPELSDVQKVYEVLDLGQWTDLSVQDCFALVSRVETNRGKRHALFAPPPPDPMTDMLAGIDGGVTQRPAGANQRASSLSRCLARNSPNDAARSPAAAAGAGPRAWPCVPGSTRRERPGPPAPRFPRTARGRGDDAGRLRRSERFAAVQGHRRVLHVDTPAGKGVEPAGELQLIAPPDPEDSALADQDHGGGPVLRSSR